MHAVAIVLARCRQFWDQSLDRLDGYLVKLQAKSRPGNGNERH